MPTDNVVGRNKIKRRIHVQRRLLLDPATGELKRELVSMFCRTLIKPGEVSKRSHLFAVLRIALYRTVGETQCESCVRIELCAFNLEKRSGNLSVVCTLVCLNLCLIALT